MSNSLAGKVAIVTGGTAGIGVAVVEAFAREGAKQVVVARHTPTQDASQVCEAAEIRFVAGDVRDPGTSRAAVQMALLSYGRLDVVVNNAGLDAKASVLEVSSETYRDVFDVNVLGTLLMMQAAARVMPAAGGSIVNVASRSALDAVAGKGLYGAAKAAVLALTRTAAVELAPRIRVNAVAPGYTDTPLLRANLERASNPQADLVALVAAVPLARIAAPEDIAHAIVYLASDASSYVTGSTLPVDGGLSA